MFEGLYNFLNTPVPDDTTLEFVEHVLNCAPDFAFYQLLPATVREELLSGQINLRAFIEFLIYKKDSMTYKLPGLNYGNLPKGLIPFHQYPDYVTTPFQEHVLHGTEISGQDTTFHFTINAAFEAQIEQSISAIKSRFNLASDHYFSVQDPASDAIAFDHKFTPLRDGAGAFITRPAGHGALLNNLNKVQGDLIFIRNIDNIQHQQKNQHAIQSRKALGGILLELRELIFEIRRALEKGEETLPRVKRLNEEFDLQIPDEKTTDVPFLRNFLNRPIRVCGMVRNEGQPGGGPFWVEDEQGHLSRQIVEKSQIAHTPEQLELLVKSTHFNPVEIVCSTKDVNDTYFDLTKFRDDNLYFIVHKTHQGIPIQYVEEPGLWNGSMANWITLFYEIESDCFSPVKTILDLLHPLHRPQEEK